MSVSAPLLLTQIFTGPDEESFMSQLEAYYDEKPVEVKGKVEIHQAPLSMSAGLRSQEGIIRTSLVYIRVPSECLG